MNNFSIAVLAFAVIVTGLVNIIQSKDIEALEHRVGVLEGVKNESL